MTDPSTPMSGRALDAPLTADMVHRLYLAGVVPRARHAEALSLARDDGAWSRWALRALLTVGVAQLLVGVVLFFAANWQDMATVAKFGVLQGGIAAAAALAWWVGLDRVAGRALLVGASVLVGVLLAVFGQIYQTGADAHTLFIAWALLILPWTVISRSAALWTLWFVIIAIAIQFYGDRIAVPTGRIGWMTLMMLQAANATAALLLREAGVAAGWSWLDRAWTRLLPLAAALAWAFVPAVLHVFDGAGPEGWAATAVFLALIGGSLIMYIRHGPDFAAVALATLAACLYACALVVRVILPENFWRLDYAPVFFVLLAVCIMAVFAGGVIFLRRIWHGRAIRAHG